MLQAARLLAVLLPLAGLAGDESARAQTLDIQPLPQKSSFEQATVRLTAVLNQKGLSCEKSRLSLEENGLQQPLTTAHNGCTIQDNKLAMEASFPRSLARREAVLKVCREENTNCETHRAYLPESAGPLTTWSLTLQRVETARGILFFQTRNFPSDFGPPGAVRVVDWQPADSRPSVSPPDAIANASGLTLEIPLDCSSLEPSKAELTKAVLEVRDSKGSPFVLTFEDALPVCSKPWFSTWKQELRRAAGGVCLALLGLLVGLQLGRRLRPKQDGSPPAELPSWLKESLEGLPEKLEAGFGELRTRIDRLGSLPTPADPLETVENEPEKPEPQLFAKGPELTRPEKEFLQIVNHWWATGDGYKDVLVSRLSQGGAKLYVSFDIDATLQRMVGRTFSFRPSDGPAGWAWYSLSKGEALAVPADPFLFHAGNMIEVLRLLFDGIGESPKSFRFYRVHKACRLRANSPGSERYQLVEKGFIELADRSGARIPGPPLSAVRVPSSGSTALPGKAASKVLESVVSPRPSLSEIEDRVRLVFKDEMGRLQHVQMPQPVATSREAIDALRIQFDHLAADLKKLDGIRESLEELALRIQSLKHVPPAAPVKDLAPLRRTAVEPDNPPSSPPALASRAEPALLVAPPPSRVTAEPAPGGFLQRLSQALPTLVTAASAATAGGLAPSDYLRRLVQLLQNLLRARADQGWGVNLVHLQVVRVSEKERMFSVHPVEICEDFREARCRCGELPEAFLVQIFLSVRYDEEDLMAIAMAASNLAERFAEGYSLLTGDEDPRDRGSLLMKRPAVLQRAKGSSESWRVILPMEVLPL